jgi:septin 7
MADSYSSRSPSYTPSGLPNGSSISPATASSLASPIIRKKLMGYVGFANLPNQVHRKSVRKGFQFTAMVVGVFSCFRSKLNLFPNLSLGESGLGKSTLINTLFNTTLYPPKESIPPAAERSKTVSIESIDAGKSPSSPASKHLFFTSYVQISKRTVSVSISLSSIPQGSVIL